MSAPAAYRKLARDCRAESYKSTAKDVQETLKRLAEAYDRQADSLEGMRKPPEDHCRGLLTYVSFPPMEASVPDMPAPPDIDGSEHDTGRILAESRRRLSETYKLLRETFRLID